MRRIVMVSVLAVLVLLLVGSRYYPTVQVIDVSGNAHYSDTDIMALANVATGDPFLWITAPRLATLTADPWIAAAHVTRHWPHTLQIEVQEREPILVQVFHDVHDDYVYAVDGTLLYGVPDDVKKNLIQLRGWGDSRLNEALLLTQLLADFDIEALAYSPQGFDIRLAQGRILTPSISELKTHWAGFKNYITDAREGSQLAVYPWGVSIHHGR